jgi:hypothetical protein
MALPASDNFNRADANPIGGNWTPTKNQCQIVSNAIQGVTFNYSAAYWSADAFGNDHYAQMTTIQVSDGGPAVRMSAGPNSYHFDAKAGTNTVMQKDVGGSFTNLQSGLATPAVNDVCYIEAVGTTIKMKINGVQIGTNQTDSSLASGSAGFWTFDTSTRFDDFSADNISTGVTAAQQAGIFDQQLSGQMVGLVWK